MVVEAEQWQPGAQSEFLSRFVKVGPLSLKEYVMTIHEQPAYLTPGDWVVAERMEGRAYPIKPDTFAATYEPVEETT